jgi:hypothetical protein
MHQQDCIRPLCGRIYAFRRPHQDVLQPLAHHGHSHPLHYQGRLWRLQCLQNATLLFFAFRSFWRRKNRDSFRHFDIFRPTKTMTYIHLAIGVRVSRLNGGASRPMPF